MKIEEKVIQYLDKWGLDPDSLIQLINFHSMVKELSGGVSDLPYTLLRTKMTKPINASDKISFYDILPIICRTCGTESIVSPLEILESLLSYGVSCPTCLEKKVAETKKKMEEQELLLKQKQLEKYIGVKVEALPEEETKGYFKVDKRKGTYSFIENTSEVFLNNTKKSYFDNIGGGSIEDVVEKGYLDDDGNFVKGTKAPKIKKREEPLVRKAGRYIPKRAEPEEIEHIVSGDSTTGDRYYSNPDPNEVSEYMRNRRLKEEEMSLKRSQYHLSKEGGIPTIENNVTYDRSAYERREFKSATAETQKAIRQEEPKVERLDRLTNEDQAIMDSISLRKNKNVEVKTDGSEDLVKRSNRVIPD